MRIQVNSQVFRPGDCDETVSVASAFQVFHGVRGRPRGQRVMIDHPLVFIPSPIELSFHLGDDVIHEVRYAALRIFRPRLDLFSHFPSPVRFPRPIF